MPALVGLPGAVLVAASPERPSVAEGLIAAGIGDDGAAELPEQLGDQAGSGGVFIACALEGGHGEEDAAEQADGCPAVPRPTAGCGCRRRCCTWDWLAVVVTGLEDFDFLVVGPVDEPVLVIDAAGPVAGQVAFERLGLADSGERVPLYLANHAGDLLGHPPVGGFPAGTARGVRLCLGVLTAGFTLRRAVRGRRG